MEHTSNTEVIDMSGLEAQEDPNRNVESVRPEEEHHTFTLRRVASVIFLLFLLMILATLGVLAVHLFYGKEGKENTTTVTVTSRSTSTHSTPNTARVEISRRSWSTTTTGQASKDVTTLRLTTETVMTNSGDNDGKDVSMTTTAEIQTSDDIAAIDTSTESTVRSTLNADTPAAPSSTALPEPRAAHVRSDVRNHKPSTTPQASTSTTQTTNTVKVATTEETLQLETKSEIVAGDSYSTSIRTTSHIKTTSGTSATTTDFTTDSTTVEESLTVRKLLQNAPATTCTDQKHTFYGSRRFSLVLTSVGTNGCHLNIPINKQCKQLQVRFFKRDWIEGNVPNLFVCRGDNACEAWTSGFQDALLTVTADITSVFVSADHAFNQRRLRSVYKILCVR